MKFAIRALVVFFIAVFTEQFAAAQDPTASQLAATKGMKLDTGQEVFEAACIGCHGPGGVGQPQSTLGFEPPPAFPDFSDCNGSTREKESDWRAILNEGGPIRAFSEIMPSWKEALSAEHIDKVIGYLRTLCDDPAWPVGELNLPRPLYTEKAFPEDEWVLTVATDSSGMRSVSTEFLYEKRFGARNQWEFAMPFDFLERQNGGWEGGIGDIVLGYKRVLLARAGSGSILSLQGEVIAPTGNRSKDLGSGVTTFETFASFGQLLSPSTFVQMQSGFELPTDTTKAANAFFWRAALGGTLAQNNGFGRSWSPMVEFLADREFETGARTNWDIVPQFQVSLNQRQHVRLNVGVRTPINNTAGRDTQLAFYLLWDTFDGAFWEGWR